jgi:tRNA-5-methyluridine54 2-sulfurtransferase
MKSNHTVLPENAKCTRCKERATIQMASHNANFCPSCFLAYFETAVVRAMKKFPVSPSTPLLVAISGGKDSLALWNVLHELGYPTRGLHIHLGIGDFSEASVQAVSRFAQERSLSWAAYSVEEIFGHSVPEIQKRIRRKICSVCGMIKRKLLNRLTLREGFQTLAVGHNLDDEAGRLLGNIVRNRYRYLDKQTPFLPATHPRLPAKIKPLYRVEAREIRLYCSIKGIQPLEQKCPLSRGATSHSFKEALDFLELRMPGTKRDFLFTFLGRQKPAPTPPMFYECTQCGDPSFGEICSVCNLMSQLQPKPPEDSGDDG